MACAVWPQLATSAVWRKLRGAGAKLILQPEFVIFMVCWLAVGSGRHERGLAGGAATTTSATGGLDQPRCGDQGGEQVLNLVAGQRDEPQRWWVAGVLGDRGHHQEGVRQHGQGHPAVPRAPAADLMLVQAAQALAGLERLLYPPAGPGDPDQGDQWCAGWAGAYVVGQLPGGQ